MLISDNIMGIYINIILNFQAKLDYHMYCFHLTMSPPLINGWDFFVISKSLIITVCMRMIELSPFLMNQ